MVTTSPRATPARARRWPRRLLVALVVLVALVAAGVLLLDRILLDRARAEAQKLSAQWGRPVELTGLSTKLVPWLGVRVTGVRIGAAAGEPRPLLELERAEVKVGLLGVLRSLGKEVVVRDLELDGLRVTVVRLPDGTTNVQRLAEAASKGPEPSGQQEKPASDLSFLHVDRAVLSGARIAFLDLSRKGAEELAIDHLDVTVKDLAAGKPLDVLLRAAVLAPAQNLEVKLHAAPLPPTLRPTPEKLSVKLSPVALDPLAPFLPKSAGFLAGELAADLAAELGAAVPGGNGATAVKGKVTARGLRFAGQEGGKALDAVLEADLTADTGKGDVKIARLDFTAGPVEVHGKGGATGLLGDAPRIDGLQVTGSGLDPRALAAFYPPLRAMVGGKASGPATFDLRAAGDAGAPALDLKVDLAAMKLDLPEQLAKAAGAPLAFTARVAFPGSAAKGTVRLDARLDATGVDLRPGGSLAKAPGDRLVLNAQATATRKGEQGWDVALAKLELLLPGDSLTASGTASVAGQGAARKVRFDLAARSAQLDLDELLLEKKKAAPKKKEPLDPATFAGLSGTVDVKLGELRWSKATFKDVAVRLQLDGDNLLIEQARLTGLGGTLDASGTRMQLAHPDAPVHVKVKLEGVDAGQALALYTPKKLLAGRVSADLDVAAGGSSGKDVLASLTGSLGGKLFDGAFLGKDVVAGVAEPLAKALPFGAVKKLAGGTTSLGKELPFGVKFTGGAAEITRPLSVQAAGAALSVEGGQVKLDGTLDLPLTVALSPEMIASITGGKAKPSEPIPVTLRLTGPAWSPSLSDLSLKSAVAAIVRSAGSAAIGKVLGIDAKGAASGEDVAAQAKGAAGNAAEDLQKKAGDEAKKALQGLFGK